VEQALEAVWPAAVVVLPSTHGEHCLLVNQ